VIPRVGMKDSTTRAEHVLQKLCIFVEVKPHPSNEPGWSTISDIRDLERPIGTCHEKIQQIEGASRGSDLGSLKSICDIAYNNILVIQFF
jgi:hypothetical protein